MFPSPRTTRPTCSPTRATTAGACSRRWCAASSATSTTAAPRPTRPPSWWPGSCAAAASSACPSAAAESTPCASAPAGPGRRRRGHAGPRATVRGSSASPASPARSGSTASSTSRCASRGCGCCSSATDPAASSSPGRRRPTSPSPAPSRATSSPTSTPPPTSSPSRRPPRPSARSSRRRWRPASPSSGCAPEPPGLALPRAVAELAAAPERCRALGAAARRTVEGRDWAVVFDALLEHYQELISAATRPAPQVVRLPAVTPAPRARRAAAFFDVDRTVVSGSCFLALARPAWRAGLISIRSLLRAGVHQAFFSALGARSDHRLGRSTRRAASLIAGMHVADVRRVGRHALASRVLPRVHPAARLAIDAHRRAGDLVFLVSAAPEELVGELATLLEVDGYAGTRAEAARGRYTGRLLRVCHGEGKVRAVEELARAHEVDLSCSTAYSDSSSDLGMLRLVGRAVCVNPDSRLRAEARRRCWEIRRFDLGGTATMSTPQQVAERLNAAFNDKDWPKLAGLMADDIECITFANAVLRGIDENRAYYATWWNAFPDCRVTAHSHHL
ncbi:MAG: HAD-IB family hydrolase, partial [Chloroflexi bacterium]